MRELFPEFNNLNKAEIKSLWKKAIFVFDTNTLLNLYRLSPKIRKKFIDIIEKLGDRAWIPNYVAMEFCRNRLGIIKEQECA